MGITFSAARVYAESGSPPPPACTDSTVTACADASAMQACDCGDGFDCACAPKQCSGASGATEALVCQQVVTSCSAYAVAPCEGKAPGAACVQTDTAGKPGASGTCSVLSSGCLVKNAAGFYENTNPLACTVGVSGSDASTTPSSPKDGDGDSGCSMPPGALGDSTLLAVPFGLGLVFALRRKRRR
ncbi:MAG: hypothetical protein KF764_00755 [Labilithrix sp.]|nr:hypothetical protein [Labilithrix sp.]